MAIIHSTADTPEATAQRSWQQAVLDRIGSERGQAESKQERKHVQEIASKSAFSHVCMNDDKTYKHYTLRARSFRTKLKGGTETTPAQTKQFAVKFDGTN